MSRGHHTRSRTDLVLGPADADQLVIVAHRLLRPEPAAAAGCPGGSSGGLGSALAGLRPASAVWVGATDSRTASALREDPDVAVVPVSPEDHDSFYLGFCNATLWPLFHDGCAPVEIRHDTWEAYERVNQHFARTVAARARFGAQVWVHDYQLLLVPAMLRELRPDLRIGFSLHIPFPPARLFRRLPWHEQLLKGVLGADLVGVQVEEDRDSFVEQCGQLRDVHAIGEQRLWQTQDGRLVRIVTSPVSVDTTMFQRLSQDPAVLARAEQIRHDLGNPRTVVLGVDRLDYTKGIPARVDAFHALLDDGVLSSGQATYVQVASPTRPGVPGYDETRVELEAAIARTLGAHGQLGAPPICYLHQQLDHAELAALYLAADVMLVTPLRDGMNLVAKEYVVTRGCSGALVLSQFAGAAQELGEAWLVNPYDVESIKGGVRDALAASEGERAARMTAMSAYVREHDVHRWAGAFLAGLARRESAYAVIG